MGKKAKKGKKKAEEPPPEEPTEYDLMTEEELAASIIDLTSQVEKAQADRNYVQVERDTIQTFYDIAKKEVVKCELEVSSRDKDMESAEENHRVQVRVYSQKVKHLEYEHKNNMKRSIAHGDSLKFEEDEEHEGRTGKLDQSKRDLKAVLIEDSLKNEENVKHITATHKKNLSKLKETFDENLEALRGKYETNLEELRMDLELRRKVEIHEIEERKNTHINDLMKNHEKAFSQIKNYYNDITCDNLKLIKSLKDEVTEMRKKATANQNLMYDIAQENKRLSEPLTVAVKEVEELRQKLKDFEKDKTSLKYTLTRIGAMHKSLGGMKEQYKEKQAIYHATEYDRNNLYDTFEDTVLEVQRKSEYKNVALEQRLTQMRSHQEEKIAQITGLCASIDPGLLEQVTLKLDQEIDQRNSVIEEMKYHLAFVHKTHNDTLRSLKQKLMEFGIPEDDLTMAKLIPSHTSSMAAGLIG